MANQECGARYDAGRIANRICRKGLGHTGRHAMKPPDICELCKRPDCEAIGDADLHCPACGEEINAGPGLCNECGPGKLRRAGDVGPAMASTYGEPGDMRGRMPRKEEDTRASDGGPGAWYEVRVEVVRMVYGEEGHLEEGPIFTSTVGGYVDAGDAGDAEQEAYNQYHAIRAEVTGPDGVHCG